MSRNVMLPLLFDAGKWSRAPEAKQVTLSGLPWISQGSRASPTPAVVVREDPQSTRANSPTVGYAREAVRSDARKAPRTSLRELMPSFVNTLRR